MPAAGTRGGDLRGLLESAVRDHVPGAVGLAPGPGAVVQLSGGASNALYRIDVRRADGGTRRVCLRRSQHGRDEAARMAMEKGLLGGVPIAVEAEVMEASRRNGVVVPEVLGVTRGGPLGAGCFMDWVDGEGRGDKIASTPAFAAIRDSGLLGRQCGEALARIQSVDRTALRVPAGPTTPLGCLRPLQKQYAVYRVCRPALAYTLRWLEQRAPPASPDDGPVLVHGDFRSANIMSHPERGLAGVLDWELLHTGNRYEDIGWICVRSWRYGQLERPVGGFAQLDDFCAGYEKAGGRRVDHDTVWWWALLGSVRWALMCIQQGLAFREGGTPRFENGVVGRRTSECELDQLCTIAEYAGGVGAVLSAGGAGGAATGAPLAAPAGGADFPPNHELVASVQQILAATAVPGLQKAGDARATYMMRVAANALGMVARNLKMGPPAAQAEAAGLALLLGRPAAGAGDVVALRAELATRLRDGATPLDTPGLLRHLLLVTGREVQMDQPKYASLAAVKSHL